MAETAARGAIRATRSCSTWPGLPLEPPRRAPLAGAPAPAGSRSSGGAGSTPGALRALAADGAALLLANVDGSLLAYRDECASCGESLQRRRARRPACCAARTASVEFDLPRAGRAAGGEPLQLTPVPLLEDGGVRVAV